MVQQAMKDAFRVEGVVCRFENQSLILSPQQHDQILLWRRNKQSPSVTAGTITTLHKAERARSQTPTPFAAARRSSQPSLRWSSHQVPPYRNGFSWSSSTLSL